MYDPAMYAQMAQENYGDMGDPMAAAGAGGPNPMMAMLGMQALQQMTSPQKQQVSAPGSAGVAKDGRQINLDTAEEKQQAPVDLKNAGLAQLLFGGLR